MSRTTYPNQRVVTIHRFQDDDKYSILGELSVVNAIRRMNGKRASGFQLWSVLRMNKDGFSMRMSERFMQQGYYLQRKAYYNAMDILEESGFLVKESAHNYHFFELPVEHFKMLQRDILEFKMTETGTLNCPFGAEQNDQNGDFKMPQMGRETDKEQIRDKTTTTTIPAPCGSGSPDNTKTGMGTEIQEDHKIILKAAADAGFPVNTSTTRKIIDLYSEYGRDGVLAGIDACVDQGKNSISYLRACCKRIATGESKKPEEDPLMPKDHVFMGWE